ncbi:DNL zinc finger-domain-containing protein [Aspergillus keveii]|uniref:DNL zinc finger-domain-containing protein n=1 Tax=Aspergillus keveii TaxID=714993 RepID=A0ABR4G1A5_9EURO
MQQSLRLSRGLRALQSSLPPSSLFRGASPRLYSQLTRHSSQQYRPLVLPKFIRPATSEVSIQARYNSNTTTPPNPLTDQTPDPDRDAANQEQNEHRRAEEPAYMLAFTCKPCGERSVHRVSKHGYHRGTVLIQCPGCNNRHIISDHLRIFLDRSKTLDDIMRENGEKIVHKNLDDGDLEFRDDELMAKRIAEELEKVKAKAAQNAEADGEKETKQ